MEDGWGPDIMLFGGALYVRGAEPEEGGGGGPMDNPAI